MSIRMPHIIDVSAMEKKHANVMPGIVNIMAMTTLTGEQKSMMDGIVGETLPAHKRKSPGVPGGSPLVAVSKVEPVIRDGAKYVGRMEKVKPSATKTAMGMTHIRGTKY